MIDRPAFDGLVAQGYTAIPLARTLQLDRDTPVSLFQRFAPERSVFLLESASAGEATGRYSFIGVDALWRLHTTAEGVVLEGVASPARVDRPLAVLRQLLQRWRPYAPADLPDLFGGAVGYVAYDYVRRLERLERDDPPEWPDVDFTFPGAVLIVDHRRYTTTAVAVAFVASDTDAAYADASRRLDSVVAALLAPPPPVDPRIETLVATAPDARAGTEIRSHAASLSNVTREQYLAMVEKAQEHIVAGDVFQVVVSQQFRRATRVDPLTLYRVLRALNPSPYMYLLRAGETTIVGASPEMLVRVHDGEVSTRPIAGTRPRGLDDASDAALEAEILADEKELAEHVMLVDLGRNDVGRVAEPGSVRVVSLAHVERYSHLMHLVSDVRGTLRAGLDAFDALFPAGTLTGAPKVRAMEIIDESEPARRGAYGGALGYFALGGGADFAITIRTLSLRDGVASVNAGGGVVAHSRPDAEYQECLNKASAPLLALAIADPA